LNSSAAAASNAKDQRALEVEQDLALIHLAQRGDMVAFRRLVERHQRRGFSVAFALVRDENDALEIVQEAFLRAFKNLPQFQGDSSFFTWLYRIITNLSIDLMRKPGRRAVEFEEEALAAAEADELDIPFMGRFEGADPMEAFRQGEIAARLQSAFDALPSYHRAVIVLRELEGLSYEEMAQALGVSKGTIMSRLFHARQKLQKALADCYDEQVGSRPAGRVAATDAGREP
jgi:RNA polymerase sigma-70 factor (ECF subfamily)